MVRDFISTMFGGHVAYYILAVILAIRHFYKVFSLTAKRLDDEIDNIRQAELRNEEWMRIVRQRAESDARNALSARDPQPYGIIRPGDIVGGVDVKQVKTPKEGSAW